ncbi:hypothetical protein [Anaerovibrio sp.]|uniref:hypothetical protein n=1 Tax=Anaerovibrio sp. TaxID=1872532 RepID=UPI0026151361|nr:hypothetical protein [Anaerovibrio sp.]MDD6598675.1 hypothetical protein [Anaerovibrio sp.]
MPTNVNSAVGPSIQPAGRTAETKTDRIAINKDGSSSSAFAKQTDVKFTNSVDNMSAVLDKIANSRLGTEAVLPKQLQEMINNVVRNAFSLENSLGEGLGSAMASERYSAEQLTILGRIFQQLGNQAEANAVSASQLTGVQAGGSAMAGELTEALQLMMANIKNIIGESALSGNTGDLEMVQLNKLAFQLLNSGNAEGVPDDLARLLQLLSGQLAVSGQSGAASSQGNEDSGILKQLVDVLFPKPLSGNAADSATGNMSVGSAESGNMSSGNMLVGGAVTGNMPEGNSLVGSNIVQGNAPGTGILNGNVNAGVVGGAASQVAGENQQLRQNEQVAANISRGQQAGNTAQVAQPQNPGSPVFQPSANTVQEQPASNPFPGQQAGNTVQVAQPQNPGSPVIQPFAKADNPQGFPQFVREGSGPQGRGQAFAHAQSRVTELENNPLFRQIFSRYGYTQETGVVKNPVQQAQQSQLANNQQTVAAFKDMAQLLLKDSSLTAKDAQLLQDFVNGSQEVLSQQDAKQLNMLLRMVQSNIPAVIQQAGQQQGMDGLPKLWAFLQLAELGTLKNIKAMDLKNASREIKTMLSSMKGAVSSEGSYKADGQKSISFVMPLYIGENEQSYPAYVNLYHEPPHEDERGRLRKDTWFRVCVLTENIGAVDIVCQLYEGNNLNLRVRFSDQEAVQAFSEYLPDIRKALYDTSVHLNDLKVGTVN